MFYWLLGSLCVIIVLDTVLACAPDLSHNCEGYGSITEPTILLPKPEEIDSKCEEYILLFECITDYQGDCGFKQRVLWQSIEVQIRQLCSSSREAYVTREYCWSGDLESEIEYCNMYMNEDLDNKDITTCRALDKYVKCCRDATEDLCDRASALVMEDLATAYVSLVRDYFNCNNKTSPGTPKTPTTPSTTTSTVPSTAPSTPATTKAKTTLSPSTTSSKNEVDRDNTNKETSQPLNRVTIEFGNRDGERDSNFETRPMTAASTRLPTSVSYMGHILVALWCLF